MDAADGGRRHKRNAALMSGYVIASLVLIGVYPVLPSRWRGIEVIALFVSAAACIGFGRRSVISGRRRTWTLLLWALVVFIAANVVLFSSDERAIRAGRIIDATGYVLLLAAGLALIIRHGARNLGAIIDAAVIAFAAGSVLWVLLPHRLGADDSIAAQVDLFAVVFALTGVLGALLRLATMEAQPSGALWWLLGGLGLVISGNVVLSLAGNSTHLRTVAIMLLMAALTALGLFGLDVSASRLVDAKLAGREELSPARIVFLGVAVAVIPVVIGAREAFTGDALGVLLAVQGALVSGLVMARIGLLSAQRTRAERSLEHQAAHDPLTHLPNRRHFVAQLRRELNKGTRCVLLFCDIDGFKPINDRYGHDVGDSVLIEVSSRMTACARPPHVVCRFGGDEFAVLLIDTTPDQTQAVRACIETAMRRPFGQAGGAVIGISIGAASGDDQRDPEELIRLADKAMYREKQTHAGTRRAPA